MNLTLEQAVQRLPEIYQPIYKHAELFKTSSRNCDDRLTHIKLIYDALQRKLNRPPRVLDLDCAQGYISLSISEWGGVVTGIDFDARNIDVCKLLAAENPDRSVEFKVDSIENVVQNLQTDQFDLVLGLSVFHHLCVKYGWENVRDFIGSLSKKVKVVIIELALREEPVHWNTALPPNCRDLLAKISCNKLLAYNSTHLSDVQRPLFFSSNYYVYFQKVGMLTIEKAIFYPEIFADKRVYYSCGEIFVKKYLSGGISPDNLNEIQQEISVLAEYGGKLRDFPALKAFENNYDEVWVAMDTIHGRLLSDIISANENFDAWKIIRQILSQLVDLEKLGLYHNDVRTWNVMVKSDGDACLIDFGAIGTQKSYCLAPSNLLLSFFIFMNMLLDRYDCTVNRKRPLTMLTALKKHLPATTMAQISQLQDDSQMFANLYKILFESGNSLTGTCLTLADKELLALGLAVTTLSEESSKLDKLVSGQITDLQILKWQMAQILALLQKNGDAK